jgi:hypothetical protein
VRGIRHEKSRYAETQHVNQKERINIVPRYLTPCGVGPFVNRECGVKSHCDL